MLKVGDRETHWVRLNNCQQNGLLAASARHRKKITLPFKKKGKKIYFFLFLLLSFCTSAPPQWLSLQPTYTMKGVVTRCVLTLCLQTATQVI